MGHRPELLVLDEPTAAVDVAARLELWRLIEGLRASGTTILPTTHQLAEAERLCTRVALMQAGCVAALGSVPELLARVPGRRVAGDRQRGLHGGHALTSAPCRPGVVAQACLGRQEARPDPSHAAFMKYLMLK